MIERSYFASYANLNVSGIAELKTVFHDLFWLDFYATVIDF